MRNPWDGNYRISCDWTCHVTRTPPSGGGTDYAMSVGTPIIAAFDGVLTNRPPVQYPASGNVAILTRADGLAFYHLHLSRFVTPGNYREGDVIGYSGGAVGAPGSGSSTGPHVHVNAYYQDVIRDVHDFYTTTAGSGTPIDLTKGFLMALNDAEQAVLYASIANIQSAIPSILLTLKLVAQPVLRDLNGDGIAEQVTQIQDNADTNTMVRQQLADLNKLRTTPTAGQVIDYDVLAAKVAALIKLPTKIEGTLS